MGVRPRSDLSNEAGSSCRVFVQSSEVWLWACPQVGLRPPPNLCNWTLVPSSHQVLVVEDTMLDARCAAAAHASLLVLPWSCWVRGYDQPGMRC